MSDSWIEVSSSNLKAIGYDEETQELDIEFHNDDEYFYRYFGVDPEHYNFLISKSGRDLGWYFWRVFRNSYPFEKMQFDEEE